MNHHYFDTAGLVIIKILKWEQKDLLFFTVKGGGDVNKKEEE